VTSHPALRTTKADLTEFAVAALIASGASSRDAAKTAEVMVWADHRGRGPQGTIWIETLAARLSAGGTASPAAPKIVVDRPAFVTIDADNGLGQVAAGFAVDVVAERAGQLGLAAATIRNSSHFGPCGFYASALAQRGYLGIAATNAYPKVAPHGGRSPVLGTNPVAFGLPATDRADIVGDLSTGAVAGSRVRHAIESGQLLDHGVALDEHGQPTRQPRELSDGGVMLPMAGPKGMALGILVEALTSVLSQGVGPHDLGSMFDHESPAGTSHFVMAMVMPTDGPDAAASMASMIGRAEPREGMEVRLPGDVGVAPASLITLDADTTESFARLCKTYGLSMPGKAS